MPNRGLHRWGPLAGVAFVALMVSGFVIAGNSPDTNGSNAKILAYLRDQSKFDSNTVTFFILLAAVLCLIGFFAALRLRLVEAEGGAGRGGTLAFGAGVASSVLLFVAIALFIAPSIAAHDAPRRVLDPGIYRLTQDLGYMNWVASVVVGAFGAWATGAVVLQTRMLPRWFGWVSVVVGVICLAAFFFFPIFIYWLWILATAIFLVARPGTVAEPVRSRPPAAVAH